jgi:hypothetical protein
MEEKMSRFKSPSVINSRKQLRHQGGVYTIGTIAEVLDLTIKDDYESKLICFLNMLSAYTDEDQFNISFNAPSSSGKTYIPKEVAKLFPKEDLLMLGYVSPTAFFHDQGVWDKEKKQYLLDLSRKILIFLDQPHMQLLEHLRPLLSHDQREISIKITDKSQKHGLMTKNVLLKGYPSVIFCTTKMVIDEQESTRFLLLSPETSEVKIQQAIEERLRLETNRQDYLDELNDNPKRKELIERVGLIKGADIKGVMIHNPEKIKSMFLETIISYKPRHARDLSRAVALVKAITLLNAGKGYVNEGFFNGKSDWLWSNDSDIEQAFKLWRLVQRPQEMNLPPFIYQIYMKVVLPLIKERETGVRRSDLSSRYSKVFNRFLPEQQLRREILPMLIDSGLIYEEPNLLDKRELLIFAVTPPSRHNYSLEGNSDRTAGEMSEKEILDIFKPKDEVK